MSSYLYVVPVCEAVLPMLPVCSIRPAVTSTREQPSKQAAGKSFTGLASVLESVDRNMMSQRSEARLRRLRPFGGIFFVTCHSEKVTGGPGGLSAGPVRVKSRL